MKKIKLPDPPESLVEKEAKKNLLTNDELLALKSLINLACKSDKMQLDDVAIAISLYDKVVLLNKNQ